MRFMVIGLAAMAAMGVPAMGQSGDPTGFVDALNVARAQRGLSAVRHDPAAVPVACENNRLQAAYGLGHHFTGGLGQVAAVGVSDARAALSMWAGSPSHAALLFAPDLVSVAYSQLGGVATASTRQSFAAPAGAYYAAGTYYQPTWWQGRR